MTLPSDRDHSGRDLGEAELALLHEVIRSGHLNSTGGTFVPRLEREFADTMQCRRAIACASGSAAVHAALAALELPAGSEVVTTPITDMGAIMPIVYEGLVPAFCDVEPETCNVDAGTIEAALTDDTKAIIVTHLFGQPCDMQPIVELARARGIPVIEDCAQAFLATDGGELVGSFGALACYSFQQGKHMTTGEGGIVTTDDETLADRAARFVNKGWGYGDTNPDHDRPGMNYRLTELQAAVGIAQLGKLESIVERRRRTAAELCKRLADVDGLIAPAPRPGSEHSYWRFALRVDPAVIGDTIAFGSELRELGVHNAPRYIQKPAFACAVLAHLDRFSIAREPVPTWQREDYPGVERGLRDVVVLPWNEHYTDEDVAFIASSLSDAARAIDA